MNAHAHAFEKSQFLRLSLACFYKLLIAALSPIMGRESCVYWVKA